MLLVIFESLLLEFYFSISNCERDNRLRAGFSVLETCGLHEGIRFLAVTLADDESGEDYKERLNFKVFKAEKSGICGRDGLWRGWLVVWLEWWDIWMILRSIHGDVEYGLMENLIQKTIVGPSAPVWSGWG